MPNKRKTPKRCPSVWHTWEPADYERFPTCSLCGADGATIAAEKAQRFAGELAHWEGRLAEIEAEQATIRCRLRHPSTSGPGRRVFERRLADLANHHSFALDAVDRFRLLTATFPLAV